MTCSSHICWSWTSSRKVHGQTLTNMLILGKKITSINNTIRDWYQLKTSFAENSTDSFLTFKAIYILLCDTSLKITHLLHVHCIWGRSLNVSGLITKSMKRSLPLISKIFASFFCNYVRKYKPRRALAIDVSSITWKWSMGNNSFHVTSPYNNYSFFLIFRKNIYLP
jgi:hypothetical protein